MIGALLVGMLVGLVVPITMLMGALLFDVVIVLWVALRLWHDDVSPWLTRVADRSWVTLGHLLRPHRTAARHAH
jgi:hypothetical protein